MVIGFFLPLFFFISVHMRAPPSRSAKKMSVVVYISDERHTLASTPRPILETLHPDDFVACTLLHPLDTHLRIEAPSVAGIREALLGIKTLISNARSVNMVDGV